MMAIQALFKCCLSKKKDPLLPKENNAEKGNINPNKEILSEYNVDIGLKNNEEEKKNIEIREDNDTQTDESNSSELNSDDEKILFDEKFIREDEKNIIKFNKNFLTQFFNILSNYEDYDLLYNQNKLVLQIKSNGSILSQDIFLVKGFYTLPKNQIKEGTTISKLASTLFNPETRMKWDTSLKSLKKIEGGDDSYIIRSLTHSPMFMVSEREVIDKRTEFYNENTFYCISTSIPKDYIPEDKTVVRVTTYFNALSISMDSDNFYFNTLSQVDLRMSIPPSLIKISLPAKILSWYKSLVEVINNEPTE